MQQAIKIKPKPNVMHGKSAITSKFEQSALRTFLPRTALKPTTEDYIQRNQYVASAPNVVIQQAVETAPPPQYETTGNNKILEPRVLPTIYHPEKQLPVIYQDNSAYNSKTYNSNTNYSFNQVDINSNEKEITYQGKLYQPNYTNNSNDMPYTSTMSKIHPKVREAGYSSSRMAPGKAKDVPYSSSRIRDKEKDVPYSSARIGVQGKDVPYSSAQINQNDNSHSKISSNSNLQGYSSQMANNLGDSTNAGYSSQMANSKDKYIKGNSNKPKGSRAPNYNKPKGSRAPNVSYSSRRDGNPEVGYSSYKQGQDDF